MCGNTFKSCGFIGVIIGVIIGIITFLLLDSGIFTAPLFILGAVLSVSIIVLLFMAISAVAGTLSPERRNVIGKCIIKNALCSVIGIIGSIVFAIAALAITTSFVVLFNVATAISVVFGIIALFGLIQAIICIAAD